MSDLGAVQSTVGAIVERDPAFNLDAFLAEAQQAFWLVGQAHATCQADLCASVLAADIEERERAAIAQSCADGTVRVPGPNDASTGQLVSIVSDASRDTATVHFRSTWRPVQGRGNEEQRSQNWCFQRPLTATTSVVVESERCNNCGASLGTSTGTCRYCGTRIGDDAGWRVIRIDDVTQQEASSAVAAMREVMATLAAARAASTPTTTISRPATRQGTSVGTWISRLFFLAVVLVGLFVYAKFSEGSVHRAVAKVVPSIKFPILKGPTDLTGRVTAANVQATLVQSLFQHKGTCSDAAVRTDWRFKAKLPDGSTFHLDIGLPPAAGGPGTYHRPKATVNADAQNRTSSLSWSSGPPTVVTLTVRPDGGGDLVFTNLTTSAAGEGPLNGHLAWSCARG